MPKRSLPTAPEAMVKIYYFFIISPVNTQIALALAIALANALEIAHYIVIVLVFYILI